MANTTYHDRKYLQRVLSQYAKPHTPTGLLLFTADMATYLAAIAVVLFVPILWVKIIASVLAGIKIANLATLSHDAAHNALTESRKLNKGLAVAGFLPGLFNYALWKYDHHHLHHQRTNETDHPDSYVPLDKKAYDELTPWQRFKYRLYRSPTLVFFGLYYIVERWWQVKFFPRATMPRGIRRQAWRWFGLLVAYLVGFLSLLWAAPYYSATGSAEALLLGFVLPTYVYQSLYAWTVYVQHNHYQIPWFRDTRDHDGAGQQAYISVHLRFSRLFSRLVHNVFDHAAHHVHPGIPCYKLPQAQAHLNNLLGDRAITTRFSLWWLVKNMRRCKLYDYDHHCWTDYQGWPTSRCTLLPHANRERQSAKSRRVRRRRQWVFQPTRAGRT